MSDPGQITSCDGKYPSPDFPSTVFGAFVCHLTDREVCPLWSLHCPLIDCDSLLTHMATASIHFRSINTPRHFSSETSSPPARKPRPPSHCFSPSLPLALSPCGKYFFMRPLRKRALEMNFWPSLKRSRAGGKDS